MTGINQIEMKLHKITDKLAEALYRIDQLEKELEKLNVGSKAKD